MIHSLAGGDIRELRVVDFAKVEIIEVGIHKGAKLWYISDINGIEVGDRVLVPIGAQNTLIEAKIERIDRFVNAQVVPVPMNRAKKIYKKIN